jgi:hypothetical protein
MMGMEAVAGYLARAHLRVPPAAEPADDFITIRGAPFDANLVVFVPGLAPNGVRVRVYPRHRRLGKTVFVAEASPITGPSRAPSLGGSRPNCLCHRSHLRFTTRTGHFADFARADYSEKCDGRWISFLNCHWQSNPRVVDAHHAPFALAQPVITTVTLGLYFHTPMHLSSCQTIGLPLFQAKRLRRDTGASRLPQWLHWRFRRIF